MFFYRMQNATDEQKEVLRKVAGQGRTLIVPEGKTTIKENIGYFRKASQIHSWFVANIQDGNDDCKMYEFEREDLHKLEHTIEMVLNASKLIPGKVPTGYTLGKNRERIYSYRDGMVVENVKIAEKRLPTQAGLCFGIESYDENYVGDLREMLAIISIARSSPAGVWFAYESSW